MKHTRKIGGFISEEVVQRVNELFHDFIADQYDRLYPEIFVQEKEKWERIAAVFLRRSQDTAINVVDIGCGTGFVPLRTGKLLRKGDVFICSDVSTGVLEIARRKIEKRSFDCDFKYVKIGTQTPFTLPFETSSADVVTINSVLHHIKNVDIFLREVDRIVKPNGLIFIGHEPNKYFYQHRFLRYNYLFLTEIFSIGNTLAHYVRRKSNKRGEVELSRNNFISEEINRTLALEGLIDSCLSSDDIAKIVDYQYFVAERGFAPESLFPDYELLHIETSDHLSFVSYYHRNLFLVKMYNRLLQKSFPKCGAVFFVVLKKKNARFKHGVNNNAAQG